MSQLARSLRVFLLVLVPLQFVTLPQPAHATFHLMQIEQVIGGVDGDASVQAIQLRMRSLGQNLVSLSRLRAWDATGSNPVLLLDIASDVANGASGSRVLIASASFATKTSPPVTPDFVLASLIPESYLAAGSLTFEDDFGNVYWRLSWGGSSYTGTGSGLITNDPDEDFNPPFGSPLPSGSAQSLLLQIASTALSTNNAANYAITSGAATFTNNAGASGTVQSLVDVGGEGSSLVLALGSPLPNPTRGSLRYQVTLPHAGRAAVALYDVAGRRLASLVDRTLPAGRQDFEWSADSQAANLQSGVYYLELRAGDERRVRRFVLLR